MGGMGGMPGGFSGMPGGFTFTTSSGGPGMSGMSFEGMPGGMGGGMGGFDPSQLINMMFQA
jgi:hypothetical protein